METALVIIVVMVAATILGTLFDGFYYWFKYWIRHPSTRTELDDCVCDVIRQIDPPDEDIEAAVACGKLTQDQRERYAERLKTIYSMAVDMHIARTWPDGEVSRE